MKSLNPKQRRKLAIWIGYSDVNHFKPDSDVEHTILLVEHMQTAPQSEAMIKEMQLPLCIAALGYVSHNANADKAIGQATTDAP